MRRLEIDPDFFEEMVYDGVMLLMIGHAVLKLHDEEGPVYQIEPVHHRDSAAFAAMLSNGFDGNFRPPQMELCYRLAQSIGTIVPELDEPSTQDPTKEEIAQRVADREWLRRKAG